ncbi:MAG: hypothetical protein LBG92_03460 [Prevotellaceae bacterium]|jgi:hypothetical protein|nr:hypothetical protein [Prevotellaceae bacterium]
MKQISIYLLTLAATILCSCSGINDNIDKYAGESIYPAKFDTIIGSIGFERVEIDLLKAGRIPANKINMGKAIATVVEYDGKTHRIDSLCSWVNITGLTESKLYRFKVYTVDEYENRSVVREIALIPFTSGDRDALGVVAPRIMASPLLAIVDWPNGLSSMLLNYHSLEYEYVDRDSDSVKGSKNGADMRIVVSNVEIGSKIDLKIKYRVIPKLANVPILDTVELTRTVTFNMPTGSTALNPVEREILEKNGMTVFTVDGASQFTRLVYPVHTKSFQDIFYFPYLRELDLTGGNIFMTPELVYNRNGVINTVGGKPWIPMLANVNTVAAADCQALKDMLEAGTLTKVKYAPNSIPGLDAILAPYFGTIVELADMPDDVYFTEDFLVNGVVVDNNWQMDVTWSPPDAPSGSGLVNVFKAVPVRASASFVFAIPKEYKFNIDEYRYLKFKVYMPPQNDINDYFQEIWPRFMNYMWNFGSNSTHGQEYWAASSIRMTEFQQWTDVAVQLDPNRHTRVIVMNIGSERGTPPNANMKYYFANFRLSKTD